MNKCCLILAAGSSSRFGNQKLSQAMPDGQPMLLATIACYRPFFPHIEVVIRAGNHALKDLLLHQSVDILECEQSVLGVGHSIACGVSKLSGEDAILIALGDMPVIGRKTVSLLYQALCIDRIVAPTYNGVRGNPVGFGREYFAELLQLKGDWGGRKIVDKHRKNFIELPVDDTGVLLDIDTPEQLLAVEQRLHHN